jgi:hypothetical protein
MDRHIGTSSSAMNGIAAGGSRPGGGLEDGVVTASWKSSPIKAGNKDAIVRGTVGNIPHAHSAASHTRNMAVSAIASNTGTGNTSNSAANTVVTAGNNNYERILRSAVSALFDDDEDNSPVRQPPARPNNSTYQSSSSQQKPAIKSILHTSNPHHRVQQPRQSHAQTTRVTFADPATAPEPTHTLATDPAALAIDDDDDNNISVGSENDSSFLRFVRPYEPSYEPPADTDDALHSEYDHFQEDNYSSQFVDSMAMGTSHYHHNQTPNQFLFENALDSDDADAVVTDDSLLLAEPYGYHQHQQEPLAPPPPPDRYALGTYTKDGQFEIDATGLEGAKSSWTKYSEDAELMAYTSYLIMLSEEFGALDGSGDNNTASSVQSTLKIAEDIEKSLRDHLAIPLPTLQLSVLNTVSCKLYACSSMPVIIMINTTL